jgi:hypothetical protein
MDGVSCEYCICNLDLVGWLFAAGRGLATRSREGSQPAAGAGESRQGHVSHLFIGF